MNQRRDVLGDLEAYESLNPTAVLGREAMEEKVQVGEYDRVNNTIEHINALEKTIPTMKERASMAEEQLIQMMVR